MTAGTDAVELEQQTFPYERKCPFAAPPEYETLRERSVTSVALATGMQAWVVAGYENTKKLLTDPRVSVSRQHETFPFYFTPPPEYRTETSFLGYDPPLHTQMRRKVAVTFTNRQVQTLRPRIEQTVDDALEDLVAAGPGVDMHQAFSLRVPMTTTCWLLGVPYEDHEFFQRNGVRLLGGNVTIDERRAAMVDVNGYFRDLVARKEVEPGDDLPSRAIAAYREEAGDDYDRREMVNLCRLMMNGGHESVSNMISLGTACFLEHPDQLAMLRSDPEMLVPAVEELIRLLSVADLAVIRVATEDIEIDGHVIPAGDGIICPGLTANHDPDEFPDPERFDITRGSRRHLAFGHGLHHCVGADMARLTLQVVFAKLFARIPTLRLARPFAEIPSKERAIVYGLFEMPIAW